MRSSRQAEGRSDMTKLVAAFSNFANAPNKYHALETCGNSVTVWGRALRHLKEFHCTFYRASFMLVSTESTFAHQVQQEHIHKVPVILHDDLQRESHTRYVPPTPVT